MIRVYLAEDSPTVAAAFRQLLEGDPDLALAGWAQDGARAREELPRVRPDILVTDLNMPGLNGLDLIRWAMEHQPLPILVLSDTAREDGSPLAFQCLEAGATEIGPKPRGGPRAGQDREELRQLLRVLAGVRVVGRRPGPPPAAPGPARVRCVGIGASTGGPQALWEIFRGFRDRLPVPVLVAQHIAPGFLEGLVAWLGATTPLPAVVAEPGMLPRPGQAHFAPAECVLTLEPDGRLGVRRGPGNAAHPHSADALFHSLARSLGPGACGVLLTGMGRDGAQGLLAMRQAGARTVAQAQQGCLVYGMPRAAAEADAAGSVLELGLIAAFLEVLCR